MTLPHAIGLVITANCLAIFMSSSIYRHRLTIFTILRKRKICVNCGTTIDESWLWKKFNNSHNRCNECFLESRNILAYSSIEQSEILITAITDALHSKQLTNDKPQTNKFIFLTHE